MTKATRITRRAALARLGLAASGVYMAPAMLGLSKAHAASSVSAPSTQSPASPATPPSPPSPPSRPSPPSGATQPSQPTAPSGPSGAGSCARTTLPGGGQITRSDYERAQQAIARGDARPLREILESVQSQHAGRLLRVGFSDRGQMPAFKVVIVAGSGAILSITVDAKSAQITNVQRC